MTTNATASKRNSLWQTLRQKRMAVTLAMGFASGLPLLLTLRTLQAWMTESHVDLKAVGFLSLLSLPYTLKFLWAPFFDRYQPLPLGRRKGWLVLVQIGLGAALVLMAALDPKEQTLWMGAAAMLVAFLSASQDILVDAYRRESLDERELALGSTFYLYGYRAAMWVSGGLALFLADRMSWPAVYLLMALTSWCAGLGTTLWADEPQAPAKLPQTLRAAVVEPLRDFFLRPSSLLILSFIFLYKLGDVMAGNMLIPYYLKTGYTKTDIAEIAKTLSLPITLFGGFLGGLYVQRKGLYPALWLFGILQMLAILGFNLLALIPGHSLWTLAFVILSEDLSTSMATAAFLAYTASLTNLRFTATQYALLSSLMGVPRVIMAAPTGWMVESVGWSSFFTLCTLIATPGLFLLWRLRQRGLFEPQRS